MKKRALFFLFVSCLIIAPSSPLLGQKKVAQKFKEVPGPILVQNCPDVAVNSFTATLTGTTSADPSFPQDTVRLTAVLENTGSVPVPSGTVLHIVFKQNDEVISTMDHQDVLGVKGSRWETSVAATFPHNAKTTFSIQITSPISECAQRNNQASFTIDEAKLHPGGAPDLTCSMFMVEKRWTQEGDHFKGTCYFAADVYNKGSGYGQGNADLMFILKKPNRDQAFSIPIKEKDLPAPGYNKRITTELADSKFDFGDYTVSAKIWPVSNEQNTANNVSTNTCILHNVEAAPVKGMVKLSFPPWGMTGRIVNIHIQIKSMQYQAIKNLRLILLKSNTPIKEWKSIELASAATIQKRTTDDRPDIEKGPDPELYKAILTTNQSDPIPPESSILDSKTRPLKYLDLAEGLLQNMLQESSSGLGASIKREHSDITIHDNETQVKITPQSVYLRLKGNYRLKGGAKAGFTVKVWLKLHARNGRLVAEIIDKDVEFGSKVAEAFLDIFTAGIYEGIKYGIEKSAEKALDKSLSIGNIGGDSPCGVILKDGYMYIYSPYST